MDVHLQPSALVAPTMVTAVALGCALAVVMRFSEAPVAVAWLLTGLVVVPAAWLALRLLRWSTSALVVTDERVLVRHGRLIARRKEVDLRHVVAVEADQSLTQRLVNTGSLVLGIQGAPRWVIDGVRHPKEVCAEVREARAARQITGLSSGWSGLLQQR